MREYLFRGKDSDGLWRFGSLIQNKDFTYIANKETRDQTQIFLTESVDPETVGQYACNIPNTDEKLFEGDIIRCRGIKYLVRWHDRFLYCQAKNINQFSTPLWIYKLVGDSSARLIGNKFDNPELLNQ